MYRLLKEYTDRLEHEREQWPPPVVAAPAPAGLAGHPSARDAPQQRMGIRTWHAGGPVLYRALPGTAPAGYSRPGAGNQGQRLQRSIWRRRDTAGRAGYQPIQHARDDRR